MAQQRSHGSAGALGEQRDRDGAGRPADDHARKRGGARLRAGEQTELVAPRAEPGEALPRALDVAPHAGGGEDREREQERRGLSAHEEQPPSRDLAGLARRGELVHGGGEIEEQRLRAQRRAGACGRGVELVHLPRMHARRRKRHRPRVRPVETVEPGQRRELVEALGDEERRLVGDAERVADAGRVLAGQPAERERGREDALADAHEAQPLRARDLAGAAQLDDLAPLRGAGLGEAARRQPHEAPEVVHGGEVRERASDAEQLELDGAHRLARDEAAERAIDERIELLPRDAVSLDAEIGVDDRDRPLFRRHALERAGERLVLRHEAAADDGGERGGSSGDAEREQSGPAGAVREPVSGQAERIADALEGGHIHTLPEAEGHNH